MIAVFRKHKKALMGALACAAVCVLLISGASTEIYFGPTLVPDEASPTPTSDGQGGGILYGPTLIPTGEEPTPEPTPGASVDPTPTPAPGGQSGILFGPTLKPTVKPNTEGGIFFGPTLSPVTPAPEDGNVSFRRRALMIYMVGSNLESKYNWHFASMDLKELIKGKIDTSSADVFLCAGGTRKWDLLDDSLGDGEVAYYQLTQDGLSRITEPRHISMGNPSTLSDFLNYCVKHSAADTFDLIMWDHGGGPVYGFGEDEAHLINFTSDSLSIAEMLSALDSSSFGPDRKLEFIGFSACLMGTVEVAAVFAPYARYMIASEDTFLAQGWDHASYGGDALARMSTTELLEHIIYQSVLQYRKNSNREILSVFDLSRAADVTVALNAVFSDPQQRLDNVSLHRLVNGIAAMEDPETYDLYDLYGFAEALDRAGIIPQQSAALRRALEKLIIYSERNPAAEGLSGCAFYFPLQSSSKKYVVEGQYADVSQRAALDQYGAYLVNYVRGLGAETGRALPNVMAMNMGSREDRSSQMPESQRQKDVRAANALLPVAEGILYQVPLDMVLDDFVRSYYTILERVGDTDTYRLVEQGHGLQLTDEGYLQVTLTSGIRMIRGGDDQPWQALPCIEAGRSNGVYCYYDAAVLYRQEKGSPANEMNGNIVVNAIYPDGMLDSLSPGTGDSMPVAVYQEAGPGACLMPVFRCKRLTLDADGNPLPFAFWDDAGSGQAYGTEFVVQSGGVQVAQLSCPGDGQYFVQICVVDAMDITYGTGLVPLN